MEEKNTLARPYALAAFKQARDEGALQAWSDMLQFLRSVAVDPAMAAIIGDPRVTKARMVELMLSICGDRLTHAGSNFVKVLVEHRRLALVREIADLFALELAKFQGRSHVEVLTAYPLDTKQEKLIAGAMEKRLGQQVDLTVHTDKSLIGGVMIRAGDLVIDASLRGRLSQLSIELS